MFRLAGGGGGGGPQKKKRSAGTLVQTGKRRHPQRTGCTDKGKVLIPKRESRVNRGKDSFNGG